MAKQHPVHTLRANLEAVRLKAIEALAATNVPYSPDALHQLASVQAALTAVSEAIATHGPTVGWGSNEGLDEALQREAEGAELPPTAGPPTPH